MNNPTPNQPGKTPKQNPFFKPLVSKPVSWGCRGCLLCLLFGVFGIFGIFGMVFLISLIAPYKVHCISSSGTYNGGFMDQASADASYREHTSQGMSCSQSQSSENQTAKSFSTPENKTDIVSADEIKQTLAQNNNIPIESVTCPNTVANKTNPYDCTAKAEGITFPIEVTLKSDGSYDLKAKGIIALKKLETIITQAVKAQNKNLKMDFVTDCGGKLIRAVKVGETFECQLKAKNGATQAVQVSVKDEYGTVDFHTFEGDKRHRMLPV
jgi:hypothetical protein